MDAPLALVDVHERTLAAPPARVWDALARGLPRATDTLILRGYARVVRCDPARREGIFPAEGSAMPGFRVARAAPPRELVLTGAHHFARYSLELRLDAAENGRATRLTARTLAAFPGARGAAYRLAVINTGGHALAMRALLGRIARAAERAPDAR